MGEVEELWKMMESLKRMVTGQGLEESSGETGDREATLEEAEEREKCVGEKTRDNSSTEESEGKKICSGTPILATHSYRKNQDSPLGNELDLQQGDTLSYILDHEDNEHWWLAEDSKGQVGYVPVSHLMIIMDETIQEEECDRTRKEVQGKSMDGAKIGGEKRQEGERRKKYSAAVIEGIKRNATTYVGDSIVRKTDARLNKGEDVVVCLPGARIEHVTERVEKIMGRGNGGTILIHVGTNNADKEGTTAIVEKYRDLLSTEEDEASKSGTDHHIRNFTSVWKQDTRIQELEEDGSQRDGGAALQGRGCGIRGFVGQLCGERRHVRERWSASEWQGVSSFSRGTVRGGRQRLG